MRQTIGPDPPACSGRLAVVEAKEPEALPGYDRSRRGSWARLAASASVTVQRSGSMLAEPTAQLQWKAEQGMQCTWHTRRCYHGPGKEPRT
jgi:hypothetical protein